MSKLGIFDLYQSSDINKQNDFFKKMEASLEVETNFEKVSEDTEWIEIMELTVPYIDNILRNPNRFIINEEEIVKIELARRVTVESIKHLSRNTNLIQDIDKKTGDVKPSKILNINKEESYDTYENKLIYSLIQNMKFFIERKKKYILQRQNVKQLNEKTIEYEGKTKIKNEDISLKMNLNTNVNYEKNETDSILARIETLEQKVADLTCSDVYKVIDKKHIALVTSPIKKTNVILKNVNFQYAVKLWNYLQENLDDKSNHLKSNKKYEDNKDLKNWANETFYLNYLIANTLDKDDIEDDDVNKEISKKSLEMIVERIVLLNSNLTPDELKDMIADSYAIVRTKHIATIGEIQKIFNKHIDKYIKKIS